MQSHKNKSKNHETYPIKLETIGFMEMYLLHIGFVLAYLSNTPTIHMIFVFAYKVGNN
ncbi:hypothetical protein [Bacillus niameyensis]|uniref:hypothetical protein n=1 Tax=Bacillus niameyensis TaxID=1522308 RepID=UPI001E4C88F8|nr:hypothetical protein [Bacillus niameyensis]